MKLGLTDEIDPMSSHEQMTIPHQRREINEPRVRIWDGDRLVEIVDGHEAGVDVLDGCSCAHAEDFVGVYVADVRSHVSCYNNNENDNQVEYIGISTAKEERCVYIPLRGLVFIIDNV